MLEQQLMVFYVKGVFFLISSVNASIQVLQKLMFVFVYFIVVDV